MAMNRVAFEAFQAGGLYLPLPRTSALRREAVAEGLALVLRGGRFKVPPLVATLPLTAAAAGHRSAAATASGSDQPVHRRLVFNMALFDGTTGSMWGVRHESTPVPLVDFENGFVEMAAGAHVTAYVCTSVRDANAIWVVEPVLQYVDEGGALVAAFSLGWAAIAALAPGRATMDVSDVPAARNEPPADVNLHPGTPLALLAGGPVGGGGAAALPTVYGARLWYNLQRFTGLRAAQRLIRDGELVGPDTLIPGLALRPVRRGGGAWGLPVDPPAFTTLLPVLGDVFHDDGAEGGGGGELGGTGVGEDGHGVVPCVDGMVTLAPTLRLTLRRVVVALPPGWETAFMKTVAYNRQVELGLPYAMDVGRFRISQRLLRLSVHNGHVAIGVASVLLQPAPLAASTTPTSPASPDGVVLGDGCAPGATPLTPTQSQVEVVGLPLHPAAAIIVSLEYVVHEPTAAAVGAGLDKVLPQPATVFGANGSSSGGDVALPPSPAPPPPTTTTMVLPGTFGPGPSALKLEESRRVLVGYQVWLPVREVKGEHWAAGMALGGEDADGQPTAPTLGVRTANRVGPAGTWTNRPWEVPLHAPAMHGRLQPHTIPLLPDAPEWGDLPQPTSFAFSYPPASTIVLGAEVTAALQVGGAPPTPATMPQRATAPPVLVQPISQPPQPVVDDSLRAAARLRLSRARERRPPPPPPAAQPAPPSPPTRLPAPLPPSDKAAEASGEASDEGEEEEEEEEEDLEEEAQQESGGYETEEEEVAPAPRPITPPVRHHHARIPAAAPLSAPVQPPSPRLVTTSTMEWPESPESVVSGGEGDRTAFLPAPFTLAASPLPAHVPPPLATRDALVATLAHNLMGLALVEAGGQPAPTPIPAPTTAPPLGADAGDGGSSAPRGPEPTEYGGPGRATAPMVGGWGGADFHAHVCHPDVLAMAVRAGLLTSNEAASVIGGLSGGVAPLSDDACMRLELSDRVWGQDIAITLVAMAPARSGGVEGAGGDSSSGCLPARVCLTGQVFNAPVQTMVADVVAGTITSGLGDCPDTSVQWLARRADDSSGSGEYTLSAGVGATSLGWMMQESGGGGSAPHTSTACQVRARIDPTMQAPHAHAAFVAAMLHTNIALSLQHADSGLPIGTLYIPGRLLLRRQQAHLVRACRLPLYSDMDGMGDEAGGCVPLYGHGTFAQAPGGGGATFRPSGRIIGYAHLVLRNTGFVGTGSLLDESAGLVARPPTSLPLPTLPAPAWYGDDACHRGKVRTVAKPIDLRFLTAGRVVQAVEDVALPVEGGAIPTWVRATPGGGSPRGVAAVDHDTVHAHALTLPEQRLLRRLFAAAARTDGLTGAGGEGQEEEEGGTAMDYAAFARFVCSADLDGLSAKARSIAYVSANAAGRDVGAEGGTSGAPARDVVKWGILRQAGTTTTPSTGTGTDGGAVISIGRAFAMQCFQHAERYAGRKRDLATARMARSGGGGDGGVWTGSDPLEDDGDNDMEHGAWTRGESMAMVAASSGAGSGEAMASGPMQLGQAGVITLGRLLTTVERYFKVAIAPREAGRGMGGHSSQPSDRPWVSSGVPVVEIAALAGVSPASSTPDAAIDYHAPIRYADFVDTLFSPTAAVPTSLGVGANDRMRPDLVVLRGKLLRAFQTGLAATSDRLPSVHDIAFPFRARDYTLTGALTWADFVDVIRTAAPSLTIATTPTPGAPHAPWLVGGGGGPGEEWRDVDARGRRMAHASEVVTRQLARAGAAGQAWGAPAPRVGMGEDDEAGDGLASLELAALYRDGARRQAAVAMLKSLNAAQVRLYPTLGQPVWFQHTFINPYPTEDRFRITIDGAGVGVTAGSPLHPLGIITDPAVVLEVWRTLPPAAADPCPTAAHMGRETYMNTLAGHTMAKLPRCMAALDVVLLPGQAVSIPFLYTLPPTSLALGQADTSSSLACDAPLSANNGSGSFHAASVAILSVSRGHTMANVQVAVTPRPPPLARRVGYLADTSDIAHIVMPLPPAPEAGRPAPLAMVAESGVVAGVSDATQALSGARVLAFKTHAHRTLLGGAAGSGPAAAVNVLLYGDVHALCLEAVWRVELFPCRRVHVRGRAGQEVNLDLTLRDTTLMAPTPARLHSSHPSVLMVPAHTVVVSPHAVNLFHAIYRPGVIPSARPMLSLTTGQGVTLARWAVTYTEDPPIITRSYVLRCDVGVESHKKIPYANDWAKSQVLTLSTDSPAIVDIKESRIPVAGKATCWLRFALRPIHAVGVYTVLLMVWNEEGGVEETLSLTLQVS